MASLVARSSERPVKLWTAHSAARLELTSFNDEPGAESGLGLTWLKQHLAVSVGMQKRPEEHDPGGINIFVHFGCSLIAENRGNVALALLKFVFLFRGITEIILVVMNFAFPHQRLFVRDGRNSLCSLQADPKELIRLVTQHVAQYSGWPEELQGLINQLHVYNERLTDFTQAQVLQGLGRGVDVHRFSTDSDYKKETILGLTEYEDVCTELCSPSEERNLIFFVPPCRTLDDGVYKIALSLAKRYSVPLWEVYMTHLEFLFTDSGYVHKHGIREYRHNWPFLCLPASLHFHPDTH